MAQSEEVRLGPQGRLVIPAPVRRALNLRPGDVLVLQIDNDRLILERREAILARLQALFADAVPQGRSLVDELIAERREEARREDGE